MSRPSLSIPRRLLPATIVAAFAALALTGCEPGALAPAESPDAPSASVEPSETPEPTGTESQAPSETPEVTTPPIAGELPCTEVFTLEQLYAFNANFAPSSEEGQLPGAVADIADAGGTVCAYQHVTGSDRLVIGVLQDANSFTAPAFESVGDIGVASARTDGLVVAAASSYFVEARDAQQVLDDVVANLG